MNKNIFKSFLKYVSFNILGMIGFSCYILADTFFVSDALDSLGLAALNIGIPAYNVMQATGVMLGTGGATKYSVYKAQGNKKSASEMLTNTFLIGMAFAVVFMIAGIFFSKPIAGLLGANDETIEYTSVYIMTLLCFAPFFISNNIMLSYVRNDGNPRLSMIAMLSSSFSNIVLDYIFIYPLNMGMFGAAFATGISGVISLTILSFYMFSKRSGLKLKITTPKKAYIKNIFSLGVSSFVTEISSGIVLIVFNIVILNIAGNTGVAAYGIVANVALVVIAIFTGASQGIQPLVSNAYAMRDNTAIKKILLYSIVTVLSISAVVYAVTISFSDNIIAVFNSENNQSLIPLAKMGFNIYFLGFFFAGFNIISSAFLSAKEKAIPAFLISLIRGIIAIVPAVIILSAIFGINGVWASFAVSEFVTFIAALIFILKLNMTEKAGSEI